MNKPVLWSNIIDRLRKRCSELASKPESEDDVFSSPAHDDMLWLVLDAIDDETLAGPTRLVGSVRTDDYQGTVVSVCTDCLGDVWVTAARFGSCSCCDYLKHVAELQPEDRARALLVYCERLYMGFVKVEVP